MGFYYLCLPVSAVGILLSAFEHLKKDMKKINESLLPELLRRDFGKDIFEGLSTHHYINVKRSAGSVPSLIAAELFTVQNKTLLFITDDKEATFYITSEMENLVGEERVLYFPETHRNRRTRKDIQRNRQSRKRHH